MNSLKNKFMSILLTLFVSYLFIVAIFFKPHSYKFSTADNSEQIEMLNNESINHSLFIHSPTFSILYHQKIYFIDEFDNLLKVYNTDTEEFENNYLDLNSTTTIKTVTYIDEFIFVYSVSLEQKSTLSIINLPDLKIEKQISLDDISTEYSQISVCSINNSYLVSLTSNNQEIKPLILTIKHTTFDLENICNIGLDLTVSESLFKITIIESTDSTNNDIYLIVVYGNEICFFGTELDNVIENSNFELDISKSSLSENLDTTNSNISFSAVNTIEINGKSLFLITYYEVNMVEEVETISSFSKLYDFAIDVSDDQKFFDSKLSIQTLNNMYILTSNSCIVYPLIKEQKISYTKLTYNSETQKYVDNTYAPIANPSIEIEYFSESEFEYFTVNKTTNLLSTPWQSEALSALKIDPTKSTKDVIVIGYGKVFNNNTIIEDYKYCLFTNESGNFKGFIKSDDLSKKQKIDINNYDYKIFKVQPNTNLYSLPTTFLNNQITDSLSSTIIHTIKDNSRVEIVDAICKYKSNEQIMLKVKVNNEFEGYIEYDKIIKPSDKVNFIITNASIKENNAKIYLNSDSESPIIYVLEKGYRIRINGSRNTDNGYTSVTFNDEYGNEFTGYILTDSINSDSWTTLQIIGCILIAINVGLLILILKFKHKHVGQIGSKYIDKSNKNTTLK